jgi:hypothetical protein
MEHSVTHDELKILLLKCIGSKYPVKVKFDDDLERTCFIVGFRDSECNKLIVSTVGSNVDEVDIQNVRRLHSLKPISFERIRGNVFNVN